MNSDKYAIYLRKSRADIEAEALGEGETLARHRKILEDLAQKYGIEQSQITVYQEIVSGESIESRPQMQMLLNDLYQRKYVGVLVVEIERLARGNTKDQGEVSDAFQYSGTKIITPSKVYDPRNEFDQEYFEFGLFMSRREFKTITRRMQAGKASSVSEGNYIGSRIPYGYTVERKSKKDRILVPEPKEADVVRMIFNMWTEENKNISQIVQTLTMMHIPTRMNKAEWGKTSVCRILQNATYIGKVVWNQKKTIKVYDNESEKVIKKRMPSEKQVYEGKHQAIISEEQFNEAQKRFGQNMPIKSDSVPMNPLAGLIICPRCGKHFMVAKWHGKEQTTIKFRHAQSNVCSCQRIPVQDVMDSLCEALKKYIDDFEISMSTDYKAEKEAMQNNIDMLNAEVRKMESKKEKIFQFLEDGLYTKEEFLQRKKANDDGIEMIKRRISELKEKLLFMPDYTDKIATLHEAIDRINGKEDVKTINLFLKTFIDKVELSVENDEPVLDVYLK